MWCNGHQGGCGWSNMLFDNESTASLLVREQDWSHGAMLILASKHTSVYFMLARQTSSPVNHRYYPPVCCSISTGMKAIQTSIQRGNVSFHAPTNPPFAPTCVCIQFAASQVHIRRHSDPTRSPIKVARRTTEKNYCWLQPCQLRQ